MTAPEIDRVRAAHRRMIGIDPDRDACAVTAVTRLQPRACRLVEPPHDAGEHRTTLRVRRRAKVRRGAVIMSAAR